MNEIVLIVATVSSAVAAVLSFLTVYLHNRPVVVVTLEKQSDHRYQLVATNLSSTASARNMRVSVASMPESYSEMWVQIGLQRESEWNIRFLAPGETIALTDQSAKVIDAPLKEMASEVFRFRYQALVVLKICPNGPLSQYNPLMRTDCPISFREPRVEDLRLADRMRKADKVRPRQRRIVAQALADEAHSRPVLSIEDQTEGPAGGS